MSLKGTVSRVKAPRDKRNWTEKSQSDDDDEACDDVTKFPRPLAPPDCPWVDGRGRGRAAFTHLGRRSRIPAAADT